MDEFQVRFTAKAQSDLNRLYEFLLEFDIHTAERALQAIENGLDFLRKSPFSVAKQPMVHTALCSESSSFPLEHLGIWHFLKLKTLKQ
jgi:plasmid stabilization system protein ParE